MAGCHQKLVGMGQETPDNSLAVVANTRDLSDSESVSGQRTEMTSRKLVFSISALSVCLFVSFLDQTCVSTATPSIAGELNTGATTSWIGASFLIASTSFQLINGRLSDIFGRKALLLACMALMAIGDLLCGFSQTAVQFYAFRSIAGIGGGGINSLVMIVVSDVTSLQNRGKYQGILGSIIALANGVGPFLGGAIVDSSTWRWVFWMIPIITIPPFLVIWFYLKLNHTKGDHAAKIKLIDYGGILLNLASTLLLLVPLSGGGVTYAWNSPVFLGLVCPGVVLMILFVLYEWKLAILPIMPIRLFRAPHCWALYAQSFLTGLAYFGNFFYLPIYFQFVLRRSALVSGALILPVVLASSATSILGGQYMSWAGSYMHCVIVGFALWTLGNGLTMLFDLQITLGPLIGILIVEGTGIGLTLQPVLVGMYANSRTDDRAVVTGLRNFIRTLGGAFGLVISGVILANTLSSGLLESGKVSQDTISQLTSSIYVLDTLDLGSDTRAYVLDLYMKGIHSIFLFFTCCSALSLVLACFVGNTSLKVSKVQRDERKGVQTDNRIEEYNQV